MHRYRHCLLWLLTAAIALGLAGCSSAPSLPAVSPNPTVSITSSAGHELLTATRLDQNQAAQLTAELQQAAADPATAAALISELGGAGLLRAVVLGSTVKGTGLADAVREVFQAGQPKLDKEVTGRIASELTDGLRVEDATQKANNVLALSFLIQDSTLNPELLVGLAPRIIEMDQQLPLEKKPWSNQTKTWADVTSSASPTVKALFENQDRTQVSDLFFRYLTLLSNDGIASLAVFTDTPLGTTEPKEDNYLSDTALARQRYLLEQRSWTHDRFATIIKVLDAATTHPETVNTPLAGGLVSSTVEMFANRNEGKTTDNQPLTFTDPLDRFTPDSLDPTAIKHLTHIVTTYLPAINYYFQAGYLSSDVAWAGCTAVMVSNYLKSSIGPCFQEQDLKVVLRAIAGTTEGITTLLTTFDTYYNNLIKNPIQREPIHERPLADILDDITTMEAKTSGFLYQTLAAIAISRGATPAQVRDYFTAVADGQTPAIPAYDQPTKTPIINLDTQNFTQETDIEQTLLNNTATHLATTRLTQLTHYNPAIDPTNPQTITNYTETLIRSFNEYY